MVLGTDILFAAAPDGRALVVRLCLLTERSELENKKCPCGTI